MGRLTTEEKAENPVFCGFGDGLIFRNVACFSQRHGTGQWGLIDKTHGIGMAGQPLVITVGAMETPLLASQSQLLTARGGRVCRSFEKKIDCEASRKYLYRFEVNQRPNHNFSPKMLPFSDLWRTDQQGAVGF
jgi:hypothetical protein